MSTISQLGLLLLTSALLGANFTFTKVAVPEFGPLPLIAARLLLAACVLGPVALAVGARPVFPGRARDWLAFGVLHAAIPNGMAAWAALSLSSSLSAVLMATVPTFTAVVAAAWLRERPAGRMVAGMALGVVGVAVLSGADASAGGGAGVAAMMIGTASYALGTVFAKRRLAAADGLALTVGSCATAGLLLLPGAIVAAPGQLPSSDAMAAFAGMALLGTVVAYGLYFRLLARASVVLAASSTYLVPVFGALLGAVVLHERFTATMTLGTGAIVVGVALMADVRGSRLRRRRSAIPRPAGSR